MKSPGRVNDTLQNAYFRSQMEEESFAVTACLRAACDDKGRRTLMCHQLQRLMITDEALALKTFATESSVNKSSSCSEHGIQIAKVPGAAI